MKPTNHAKGRILFLSYPFPPLKAVACVRTWAVAKYLSRSGWHVRVVTPRADIWAHHDPEPLREPEAENIEILRTGYCMPFLSYDTQADLHPLWRRIAYRLRSALRMCGVEPMFGWRYSAQRMLRSQKPGSADVILASGPPFASFSLARALSVQLQSPFILDYRDPWTRNAYDTWRNTARNRRAERALLGRCKAVTTVSPHFAQSFQGMCSPDKIHIVTNGYDPERLSQVAPYAFSEKVIVYAGMLYPPLRTLEPILQAMAEILLSAGARTLPCRLHYFGPHGKAVTSGARQLGVDAWVVDHGSVSRQAALAAVAGANLVVVVTSIWPEGDDALLGTVPGKVFEALGLGKRILVVAPDRSDIEAVVGANGRRFSGSQTKEIADYMLHSTNAEPTEVLHPPTRYSWEHLVLTYDALLTEAIKRPRKI